MKQELCLPKKYLSYSQMRLWLEDKNKYRDKYYRDIMEKGGKEMWFGSEVAKGLEDKTLVVPGLILYPEPEHRINYDIDGVPVTAYIDQYDPGMHRFRETKTGRLRPNGAPRWTQIEVDNHMQLDVYSLMIQVAHGWVEDECWLDWLHTRPKMNRMEFDGHVLESEGRGMELTGEVTSFKRVIQQKERDRMRAIIVSIAQEISSDYKEYLNFNASRSPLASSSVSTDLSGK